MSESDTSSRKRLNELRVADLRYHLEKRGLDKNGVKTALVERLSKAIEAEGHNPEEFLFDVQVESAKPIGKVAPVKRASRRRKESGTVEDGCEEEAEEEKQDDQQEVKELNKDEEENQEGIHCNGGKSLQNSRQGDTSEDNASSSPAKPESNSTVAPLTAEDAKNSSRHDKKTCNNDTTAAEEGAVDANTTLNTPVKKEDQVEDSMPSRSSKDSTVKAQNTEDKGQKKVTSTEKNTSGITVDNLETKTGVTELTNQQTESTSSVVSDAKVSASPAHEVKGISTTTTGKSACANKKEDIKKVESSFQLKDCVVALHDKSVMLPGATKSGKEPVCQMKNGAKVKVAESSKNLWVSGLSEKTRATDLKALFSKHGRVLGAKIVTNSKTPPYKHLYGFVMMASTEDASSCVKRLHHTELHGRLLSVEKTTLEPGSPAKKVETQQGDSSKAVKSVVPVSNEDKKEKKEGPEKNNLPPEAEKETEVKSNEEDVQTEEKEPEAAEVTEEDEKKVDEEMEEKTSEENTPKSADEKEKDKEEADTTKKQEGSEERHKRRRRSRSRERSIRSRHHSREHRRPRRSRSRERYRQLDPYYKGREYGRSHISDRPHSRSYHERHKHYDYRHRSPERRPSYSKIEQEWEKVRMEKSRLEYDLLKLQREKQQVDRARLEVEKAELRMHAQMVELEERGTLKRPFESRGVKDDYWEDRRQMGPESESPGRGNDYDRERVGYAEKRGRFDTRNHVDKPAGRRDGRPIPNDAPFSRGGHHGEGPDRHVRDDWKSGSRNSFGSNERGRSFERPAPWDTSAEHDPNKFGPSPGPPPVQWGPIKEKWEGLPPGSWGGMEHPRGPPPAVAHPPPNQPMFGGPGNGMGNRMPGGFQPNRFGMNNIRRF